MEKASDKKTLFDYFIEFLGWLQFVASPLVISLVIAGFVYFPNPSNSRLIISALIVLIGLIVGIIWATSVWRTKGTNHYLTTLSSSPDFDKFTGPKE
jgi:disulfide bond formation protein DsbB